MSNDEEGNATQKWKTATNADLRAKYLAQIRSNWKVQEIWATFPRQIRPTSALGKSALGGLNSISLRMPLREARDLLIKECGARGRARVLALMAKHGQIRPDNERDVETDPRMDWERVSFKHIDTISKRLIISEGGAGHMRAGLQLKGARVAASARQLQENFSSDDDDDDDAENDHNPSAASFARRVPAAAVSSSRLATSVPTVTNPFGKGPSLEQKFKVEGSPSPKSTTSDANAYSQRKSSQAQGPTKPLSTPAGNNNNYTKTKSLGFPRASTPSSDDSHNNLFTKRRQRLNPLATPAQKRKIAEQYDAEMPQKRVKSGNQSSNPFTGDGFTSCGHAHWLDAFLDSGNSKGDGRKSSTGQGSGGIKPPARRIYSSADLLGKRMKEKEEDKIKMEADSKERETEKQMAGNTDNGSVRLGRLAQVKAAAAAAAAAGATRNDKGGVSSSKPDTREKSNPDSQGDFLKRSGAGLAELTSRVSEQPTTGASAQAQDKPASKGPMTKQVIDLETYITTNRAAAEKKFKAYLANPSSNLDIQMGDAPAPRQASTEESAGNRHGGSRHSPQNTQTLEEYCSSTVFASLQDILDSKRLRELAGENEQAVVRKLEKVFRKGLLDLGKGIEEAFDGL